MSDSTRYGCDTSVAIPALDTTHAQHPWCLELIRSHRPALAGHAAIETLSVLTRLPAPSRLSATVAARAILHDFPVRCPFAPDDPLAVVDRFARLGLAGGAVYDGLIALAASGDGRVLLTRDSRAEQTYRRLDIAYRLVVGPLT